MKQKQLRREILKTLDAHEPKTIENLRHEMADQWKADGHWPLRADILGRLLGTRVWLWAGKIPSASRFEKALRNAERLGLAHHTNDTWELTPLGSSRQKLVREYEADPYNFLANQTPG